ncbi:MAG: diguanylate cyclase [Bermanella sp.]
MNLMFLDSNQDVSTALQADYLWGLVAVSYCAAYMAAFTAWGMSEQFRLNRGRTVSYFWLGGGAIAMGCGIWAMHFIAMLAYQLPIPVAYDISGTLLSVVPAILASIVAIYFFSYDQLDLQKSIVGGIIFGAGIGTMHYSGMAAMHINAQMVYDKDLFIASIFIAVALSYLALWLKILATRFRSSSAYSQIKALSISIVAAAIAAMHYMGMAAVYFLPMDKAVGPIEGMEPFSLAILVILITGLIMGLGILTNLFQSRLNLAYQSVETSKEQLNSAINSISDGFVLFDDQDKLVMANNVFKDMYKGDNFSAIGGIQPGISYQDLVAEQSLFITSENSHHRDYFDKRLHWHDNPVGIFNETLIDGRQVLGKEHRAETGDLVGTWTDISPLKKVEGKLRESREQITRILEFFPSSIVIRSLNTRAVLYFNEKAAAFYQSRNATIELGKIDTFLGVDTLTKLGKKLMEKGEIHDMELQFTSHDNELITLIYSAVIASYEHQPAAIISFTDITERKNMEEQLRTMAQTDSLTGVFNRRYFTDMGKREFVRCRRNNLPLSLIILDIDHFKRINDQYGHDIGDEAIKTLCDLVRLNLRDLEMLARIGGEEFAILLPDKGLATSLSVANRIRTVIENNVLQIKDQEIQYTVSMGICELNSEHDRFEALIKSADVALFKAKNLGRNRVENG